MSHAGWAAPILHATYHEHLSAGGAQITHSLYSKTRANQEANSSGMGLEMVEMCMQYKRK